MVHRVCSTYDLAREIEWSSRLFVIDMLDQGEEGIGTMLNITHRSPALEGEVVVIEAIVDSLHKNELICSFTARTGDRVIAEGKTGQKILSKVKLGQIFSDILK